MSLGNVGIVYQKELTEALRDRRTLISTIIVPLLLFPILSVGFGAMAVALVGKAKEETPKVMILGGEDSPEVVGGLKKLDKIEIVPAAPAWKDQIINKEVRAAVEIPPGFQSDVARQKSDTVKIYNYKGELKSEFATDKIEKYLKDYRDSVVKERLAAKNLPEAVLQPFEVKQENVAPPEKVSGAAFGGIIGYMVILLCMTGGMYPAMDLTAGEKERGTMETILSSPISRMHLVLGKFFLVLFAPPGSQDRAVRLYHGSASGGILFRHPDDHCPLRQNLQRSAELSHTDDLRRHYPGDRRHAPGRRAHSQARAHPHSQHEPTLQRTRRRHLPLEFHLHHFCFHLLVCRRSPLPGHPDVPARIRALSLLTTRGFPLFCPF